MMKRDKEFDNILDICLERVFGGEPVEACLKDYPQYAGELEPLLRTVMLGKEAAAVEPRPEFRERARYQFQAAVRDMEAEQETHKSHGIFGWQPRWVTAAVGVLAIILACSGTVAAAGNSLPGDALYSVKLATESVRLALTPSAMGKAELYVELADVRVEEITRLAERGDAEQVGLTAERLNTQMLAMVNLDVTGAGGSDAVLYQMAGVKNGQETERGSLDVTTVTQTVTTTATMPPAVTTTSATTTTTTAGVTPTMPRTVETPAPTSGGVYDEGLLHTPPAVPGSGEDWGAEAAEPGTPEALRQAITRQYEENLAKLEAALEGATGPVRAALEAAMITVTESYQQALINLG